ATELLVTEGQPQANGQLPPKASYGAPTDPRLSDGVDPSGGQVQDAVMGCDAVLGACTAAGACNGASPPAVVTAKRGADLEVMELRTWRMGLTWRALVPYSTTSHDESSGSMV
ncbi:hypothetical protein Vafri_9633, partial [Volvox africanus]